VITREEISPTPRRETYIGPQRQLAARGTPAARFVYGQQPMEWQLYSGGRIRGHGRRTAGFNCISARGAGIDDSQHADPKYAHLLARTKEGQEGLSAPPGRNRMLEPPLAARGCGRYGVEWPRAAALFAPSLRCASFMSLLTGSVLAKLGHWLN
jgi:hypothetical protein